MTTKHAKARERQMTPRRWPHPRVDPRTRHTETRRLIRPTWFARLEGTRLSYDLRCIADLRAMLVAHGDWMLLGNADEQKPAKADTVEAWARSADNPVGGWYGLKKGLRGRFANYVPPVLEVLGLAEVEHNARNNRMSAI